MPGACSTRRPATAPWSWRLETAVVEVMQIRCRFSARDSPLRGCWRGVPLNQRLFNAPRPVFSPDGDWLADRDSAGVERFAPGGWSDSPQSPRTLRLGQAAAAAVQDPADEPSRSRNAIVGTTAWARSRTGRTAAIGAGKSRTGRSSPAWRRRSRRTSWGGTIEPVNAPDGPAACSGRGRNRTGDTRIFSPLLYQLSYPSSGMNLVRTVTWRDCQ